MKQEQFKNEEVLKIIEQAARDGLTELSLYDQKLTSLPAEIGQLKNLTELSLHRNNLTSLPAEIGQLKNLTELSLNNNKLISLPAEIGQLQNLTGLWLSSNNLTFLPAEIGQLKNLITLNLRDNKLTSLPTEIAQLKKLEALYLHGNDELGIPPEVLGVKRKEEGEPAKPGGIIDYYFRQQQEANVPDDTNERSNEENKSKLKELQNAFREFLIKEKGYPPSSIEALDRDKFGIFDVESKMIRALIGFTVSNSRNVSVELVTHNLLLSKSSGIAGYLVCTSPDNSSEPFELLEVSGNGYESILINDFPTYKDITKEDTKTDDSGSKGGDDLNPVREYHHTLILLLSDKKGCPNGSVIGEGSWQDSGEFLSDVTLRNPENRQILAILEANATKEGELYVREKSELIKKATRLGVPLYVLSPEVLNSDDDFGIQRLTEKGNLEEIAIEDFPTFEELKQKAAGKKLDLFNFKIGVDFYGDEICNKIIDLATSPNIRLDIDITHESFINLRAAWAERKTDNVVMQIHRYGEPDTRIALAIAGVKTGATASTKPELNDYIKASAK